MRAARFQGERRGASPLNLLVTMFVVAAVGLFVGCSESVNSSAEATPKTASEPGPSLTLRVLVVNEPELAESINRLRGEWEERGAGKLTATSATWADVAAAKSLDADIIVFPSRYLGEMCVRGWLRPVRANVLESDDFNVDDLFPLVRQQLMKWGGQTMAVPLGTKLATTHKVGEGHEGLSLLQRVAPKVVTRARLGELFDLETMKPRITEPAFVEGLGELVAERKSSNDERRDVVESSPGRTKTDAESQVAVPVIGFDDRLAAVTASSRNAASAFKLLEWLASSETSSKLALAGGGTMPVRRSMSSSARWYDENLSSEERVRIGKALEEALTGDECLTIPRIPGIDEYMSALGDEVKSALMGDSTPQQALEKTARRWEVTTEARGRESQREAYLKHLGLTD
jgi:ABC-type glycerol-3-phosphate transport system substrate-binding protein